MSCFLATNGAASTKSKFSRDLVYVCRRSKMRQNRCQQMNKTKRFWSLLVAALVLGNAGSYAAARKIMPPTTPADIKPPAGNSAFLVGHAVGTQGYVCLPTSTGASWTVNGSRPEATLFSGQDRQIVTHFLSPDTNPNQYAPNPLPVGSPTWQSSVDSSVVWAKALTPAVVSGSDELPEYWRDPLPFAPGSRIENWPQRRQSHDPDHIYPTLEHHRRNRPSFRLLRPRRCG